MAFPSVIVSVVLLQISIKTLLFYEDEYYTWTGAFMFGSIASCTDPIAVVALLKDLGTHLASTLRCLQEVQHAD